MNRNSKGELIIFENRFLNSLTKIHPALPLFFWLPVLVFCIYMSSDFSFSKNLFLALCGILVWTLSEYLLHRFAFHFKSDNSFIARWIYIIHGNHHDDQTDRYRGVMPPLPAYIYGFCIWFVLSIFFGPTYAFSLMSGVVVGYLSYDYLHYSFHHFNLSFRWWKKLRRLHAIHHNQGDIIFGVSSPLWDFVFGTYKKRRK